MEHSEMRKNQRITTISVGRISLALALIFPGAARVHCYQGSM